MTKKIFVIRHAEKPEAHGATGVMSDGQPDSESLTPRGWQRAGALVQLFVRNGAEPRPPLERPRHLFAAQAKHGSDEHSKRPYQTIEPLNQYLKLPRGIDDSLRKDEFEKLLQTVTKLDGTVLIAWEHKNIPPMARLLLPADDNVPDWPEDRFDMVWVFERQGKIWRFSQVPQLLLGGDKAELFT